MMFINSVCGLGHAHANSYLKFNLHYIQDNIFLPSCCCIKKEDRSPEIVHIKAKNKTKQDGIVLRRLLTVSCLHSEFRGFLIR